MPFVLAPSALVLIAIGIILDTEAVLLVIFPITDILMRADPFIWLLGAVFVQRLFLLPLRYTLTQ